MKLRSLFASLLLCLPVLALASDDAGSWWNEDWQYRKQIGFDATPAGADLAESVTDAPVLLRLSTANFNYFGDAKPDGTDFRAVSADGKNPLKFHFEKYDSANQMAFLWVRVPQITAAAATDKIHVYYGNPDADGAGEVGGTYDPGTALVLHFSEADGKFKDATSYANNPSVADAEANPASLIAGGAKFNGAQKVTVPGSTSLRLVPGSGMTASAWVKFDTAPARATILAMEGQGQALTLGVEAGRAQLRLGSVSVNQTSGILENGTWHHLAMTAGGGRVTLYVDGVSMGEVSTTLPELAGTLTVGAYASGSEGFVGEIDEVNVSKVARSASWVRAAARSQGMAAMLVTFGSDDQRDSGGHGSYFGTIAKNLTVDSWAVIFICFGMLVLAVIVMVGKAIYLNAIEKQNRLFLAAYDAEKTKEDALDPRIRMDLGTVTPASTLGGVYAKGMDELSKRLPPAGHMVLAHQSTEAIRAAMEATVTRQGQKHSANMVVLTIAISGGPFLGLLGTVVGVMITFAAIAASGEVNVNAIAPGVAAALAATVAGLAVAIPSLFGYNWLNLRIKAVSADTRVFVDEVVARIAEKYR